MFLKYIKNQFSLSRRIKEDEELQKKEIYSITFEHATGDSYLIYQEAGRRLSSFVSFSLLNNATLYVDEVRRRYQVGDKRLTSTERQIIMYRLCRYLSCWGGKVFLQDSYITDLGKLKDYLKEEGIPFEENNGAITYPMKF